MPIDSIGEQWTLWLRFGSKEDEEFVLLGLIREFPSVENFGR